MRGNEVENTDGEMPGQHQVYKRQWGVKNRRGGWAEQGTGRNIGIHRCSLLRDQRFVVVLSKSLS